MSPHPALADDIGIFSPEMHLFRCVFARK